MKTQPKESVVQDWVMELPFMQQALLMTAMRGPDGMPKHNTAKSIVKFLRGIVLKPAGEIKGNEDTFMWIRYDGIITFEEYMNEFFCDTDAYPMHFLMHLIHAAEVIAYKHPDSTMRNYWVKFYGKACNNFHMYRESCGEMDRRMSL